jgi:hypothetical protein
MQPTTVIDPILREAARRFTHLVKWVDYHSGPGTKPLGSPARLTLYTAADDAGVESLDEASRASTHSPQLRARLLATGLRVVPDERDALARTDAYAQDAGAGLAQVPFGRESEDVAGTG